ncbi:MAG: hypothetical protein ACM37U_08550, partial [Gemmatimonas sp.]
MRRVAVVLGAIVAACATAQPPGPTPTTQPALPAGHVASDSMSSTLIPAGLGTVRQDSISIVLQPEGVRVSAIPLDEAVIRVLASDSYRALHATLESKRQQIMQRASMRGVREPRVWYVRFYGLAPDARFVPTDFTVTSGGREYRPLDVIPLSPGFGTQRLQPREQQAALLLFEDGLDVSQPLVVTMGSQRNTDWETILLKT